MNSSIQKTYLPAAGRDWALPLYDPLTALLGINRVRRSLLESANLKDASRVLDVGCGTGTLALAIKQEDPHLEVVGLDPDPKALERAARKNKRAAAAVTFTRGYSEELPYADGSFDRVFSSFMFHHVPEDAQPQMLREAFRVLRTGGSLHLVDMSRIHEETRNGAKKLHGMSRHMGQKSDPHIVELFQRAGFSDVRVMQSGAILFGLVRVACFCGFRYAAG